MIANDKRTLWIVLKIGIKRKELDPNHDLPVEPTLSSSLPKNKGKTLTIEKLSTFINLPILPLESTRVPYL